MAAINFPTATSNGQTFEADTGVIYTYVGTPPNGFWSATFGTTGLATLDGRFVALNDGNSIQTMQTQGLKFNNGSADTILLDGVNGNVGIGNTSASSFDSEANNLVVGDGTGDNGITIYTGTAAGNHGSIFFADGTGSSGAKKKGQIRYEQNNEVMSFHTNEQERLRINLSGDVGIGNQNPQSRLHVGDTAATLLKLQSSAASTYINFINNSNTLGFIGYEGNSLGFYVNNLKHFQLDTDGTIKFSNSSNERMRINSSGDVELYSGSTNEGFGVIRGKHSPGNEFNRSEVRFGVENNSSGLGFLAFATGNNSASERMRIDSSGKVGIGGSPTYMLDVQGTDAALRLKGTSSTGFIADQASSGLVSLINYDSGADLRFGTASTERMRIDSSGNVIFKRGADVGNILQITGADTTSETLEIGIASGGGNAQLTATNAAGGSNSCGLIFRTRGTSGTAERMRIDSTGVVGIGMTPGTDASSTYMLQLYASSQCFISIGNATSGSGPNNGVTIGNDPNSAYLWNREATPIKFATNNSERMQISSTGRVLIGKTATNFSAQGIELRENGEIVVTRTVGEALVLRRNGSNGQLASFRNTNGSTVGTIVTSSSSTAYNTSSDYRLKENVVDLTAAIPRLKTLPVHRFNFITDSELTVDGFLAHEAQLVVPESVTGEKDGEQMQGIDQSKLIPLLTAALQESITKIEALESADHYSFDNTLTVKQPTSLLNNPFASFLNSSGDTAGAIIQNGVNSVTYATSSDYRLKDNVVELTAAIPRLKQLAPKRFNFKSDADVTVDGFLAHEAQVVVPEAVTGTHNQLDGDGNAIYQGIDQSKLVPLLTASLQEAIGRIETLETEVAALKAG